MNISRNTNMGTKKFMTPVESGDAMVFRYVLVRRRVVILACDHRQVLGVLRQDLLG